MTTVLENESLKLTISDAGAELVSAWDKEKEIERIWCGDPKVWGRHAPILFPFVGKVKGGSYRYNGKEYSMPGHGFARDRVFECVEHTDTTVTYLLKSDEESLKMYPFSFALYITYRLAAGKERLIDIEWRVVNEGDGTMLYSIGGHPAFTYPQGNDANKCFIGLGEHRTKMDTDKEASMEYYLLSDKGLVVTDEKYPLELKDGRCQITDNMFDRDALVFMNNSINEAELLDASGKPYVRMKCQGFPYFGIWSKAVDRFLCLEPWYGVADTEGHDGELSSKVGVQKLAAGETREYSYSVELL